MFPESRALLEQKYQFEEVFIMRKQKFDDVEINKKVSNIKSGSINLVPR